MEPTRSTRRSLWLAAFLSMAFAAPVSAGHPSVETWSTTVASDDTTDCLEITELGGPQSLISVDNQCAETFTLDSVTCSAVDCMLQTEVQIEPEATRQIGSFDIGLFGNELQAGDTVDVELGWSVGSAESGTIGLTLTYEGYTGGVHDGDVIGGGSDGSKGDPGCGGCSAVGSAPGGAFAVLVLFALAVRRRAA